MISDRRLVRLRAALDGWFVVVVVALLALSLIGGWAAYGSVATPDDERTDHQTVEAWSTTGGFEHSATVQEENEVFPVETDLSDRPVYFTEVTPELDATFTYWYDAPSGDIDVDVEAERVIRSVDDEDEEYWSTNDTLEERSEQGLMPGDEHETAFSVDVPAMMNETERVEESLGGSAGTVETAVVVHVGMEGTIDGEAVDRVETYELQIEDGGATYSVDAPAADERSEQRTEEVATAGSSGFFGPLGPILLAFVSICALGALVIARRNGTLAPSAAELERVRTEHEREEFDDWISRGSLPDDVRDRSRIEVATLEDLVDVAIDSDRRVIEDEDAGEYYVVDGDSLYVYEPTSNAPVDDADSSSDNSEIDRAAADRTPEENAVTDGSGNGDHRDVADRSEV